MNKNQKRLLCALVAVITMSVTAACDTASVDAKARGKSVHSVFDGGVFTVLRHEKGAPGHQGALILSIATKEDKSTHALAFLQTHGDHAGKGMACGVATEDDDWLRCVSAQGQNNLIEVLTVANLDTDFCEGLRDKLKDGAPPNFENPVMEPAECKKKSCVCYRIEHLNADSDEPGNAATTVVLDPPGRGSGSGGTD